jgi:hypothetical protein
VRPSYFPEPEGKASDGENDEDYDDIQYLIISRRSRQRAGLRYLRRGIDDEANVANFVETEAIMKITVSDCIPALRDCSNLTRFEGTEK